MTDRAAWFGVERKTLQAMLAIYCRGRHAGGESLCADCQALLEYAEARLEKCPFGTKKPVCSQCTVHCYKPAMRARVRDVMKYAGPRMLGRHPMLALRHLAQGVVRKRRKAEGK